jgi:hypothetical protein
VVFAGTDDLRTSLEDGDLLLKPFGPLDEYGNSIMFPNSSARVHAGFDNALFLHGLFDRLLSLLNDLRAKFPHYRIMTTGHSLGAANSVLLSVGLATQLPDLPITCINYGAPKTGNWAWRDLINERFPNVAIWRFVLGWDLVPRLPEYPFQHVGHTVQLNPKEGEAFAYYLHEGNATLGYAGVPIGWSSTPFIWVPGALYSHFISNYKHFFLNNTDISIDAFVKVDDPGPSSWDDDDYYINPPDDVIHFEDESDMAASE